MPALPLLLPRRTHGGVARQLPKKENLKNS
jgi:hypothetical protein